MIPADLFYGAPGYAKLFLAIPFILLFFIVFDLWRERKTAGPLQRMAHFSPRWIFWLRTLFLCAAWFFAVVALMDPKGGGRYPTLKREKEVSLRMKRHHVLFLLDTSASMEVTDERGGKSRLDKAKEIIGETVKRLKGETVSLHAFTSETDQFIPETMDSIYFRLKLDDIGVNEGGSAGTDLTAALKEILKKAGDETSVVVLSDGGEEEVGLDFGSMRIYAIGLGTKEGGVVPGFNVPSALNENALYEIASRGTGKYYSTERYSAVEIAEDLSSSLNKKSRVVAEREETAQEIVYDSYYFYPLAASLFFLLAVFALQPGRRGD